MRAERLEPRALKILLARVASHRSGIFSALENPAEPTPKVLYTRLLYTSRSNGRVHYSRVHFGRVLYCSAKSQWQASKPCACVPHRWI